MKTILKKSKNEKNKYIDLLNKWYLKNYKKAPFLIYPVGWSIIDPIFLEIRLNDNDEIVDFLVKEH